MATLKLKNLFKYFGETKILDDINLSINDGEFVVLVGPSGSGKSTILRTVAGLEEPTSGQIEINNKSVNNLQPKDRDIAMVFQNYALYPHMTVFENLSFPLRMMKYKKDEIKKTVLEAASLLGIKQYLTKKPKELSGGERQRVALGRAIVRKPKLFLMDEPLSNLDAKLRTQMRSELLKIHKALSATVIYVTHDQVEALTMGNKIAVLNHGKIQQIGTPSEIYNNPVNTFVAGFIGSPQMNLFDLESGIINKKDLSGKKMFLGVRPEHMSISNNGEAVFESVVELVEMLGNEYIVYLKDVNYKSNFSIKVLNGCNLKRNDKVKVKIDFSKALYFDKSSTLRVHL